MTTMLPDELYEVLRDVVAALSQGPAITVAPQHTVLTTSQTADLLGASRPTLVRLLEAGKIPFDKPGRHRRIRLGDLLAYQQRPRRLAPPGSTRWSERPRTPAVHCRGETVPAIAVRGHPLSLKNCAAACYSRVA
ncbi:MAG: helix-turn-helix domain-containing protein [Pseudonocardiaceae bacterium]